MGTDKSLLNYHGKPQRYFLYEMIQTICAKVFLSCNKDQAASITAGYNFIPDDDKYASSGPVVGLLTAFEKFPDYSFLVTGCDYPFIKINDLKELLNEASDNSVAACYYNPETKMEEPLLAVYKKECSPLLLNNFHQKKYSLKMFLQEINAVKVLPHSTSSIHSVDTFDDYNAALNKIKTGSEC
jgi:molybdopterin-guanine dinucleotide biosynthesis protein A